LVRLGLWTARGIERVEIGCRPHGEFFQLAFANVRPRITVDHIDYIVEGGAAGFNGRQTAQAVGKLFRREIQQRVGGIKISVPVPPVGETPWFHITENAFSPAMKLIIVSKWAWDASKKDVGNMAVTRLVHGYLLAVLPWIYPSSPGPSAVRSVAARR